MVFAGEGGNLGERRTETGLFLCRANDGGTLVDREGSVQPGRSTTKMPGIWGVHVDGSWGLFDLAN